MALSRLSGALAELDEVSEDNLNSALKEKVNAAAEGNHSHSNKTVQKFSELQNRFDVLADEYCIYKNVEDSDGATIEDSNGDTVIGKVVYAIR